MTQGTFFEKKIKEKRGTIELRGTWPERSRVVSITPNPSSNCTKQQNASLSKCELSEPLILTSQCKNDAVNSCVESDQSVGCFSSARKNKEK